MAGESPRRDRKRSSVMAVSVKERTNRQEDRKREIETENKKQSQEL
jgi:hypothetical protein